MKLFTDTCKFSLITGPLQVTIIQYKSRIATAIRGLLWMKMTIVNLSLKGLISESSVSLLHSLPILIREVVCQVKQAHVQVIHQVATPYRRDYYG